MATEIQRILIKYEADIKELTAKLDQIQKEMAQTGKSGSESVGTIGKSVSGLGGIVKTLGPLFASAFSAKVLLDFGKGMFELQKQAQTIRASFKEAFDDPTYLDDLRKATNGTIGDLELMKLALRAKEFNIPRDVFADGLQFASIQADKLGKSSEELRDKLLDAFGSRNARALKDLGISTDELNAKVRETGDFYKAVGAIIEETIAQKATPQLETLADRQDKINASLQNLGLRISDSLVPVFEVLVGALESAVSGVENLQSTLKIGFAIEEKKAAEIAQIAKGQTEELVAFYNGLIASGEMTQEQASAAIIKRIQEVEKEISVNAKKIRVIGDEIATTLNVQSGGALFSGIRERSEAAGAAVNRLLPTLEALKQAYSELNEEGGDTVKEFDLQTATVAELQGELQRLNGLISGQSDRSIIAGFQKTAQTVKDRLDFLLGVVKKGNEKVIITQEELAKQFLEAFDLAREIDLIGLDTESAIDKFWRERFEQLENFKREFERESQKLNLFGRTEEEQGDFDALGMSLDDFIAKRNKAAEDEKQRTQDFFATFSASVQGLQDISQAASNARIASIEAEIAAGRISEEAGRAQLNREAERQANFTAFFVQLQQFQAIASAIASGAKLPVLIPLIVGSIIGFFSRFIGQTPQAPGFAVGTSDAPGGTAWVGERGKELMHVPKGARIYTAKASRKERSLIDALNAGKHEEFIYDHYLKPFAAKLQGSQGGLSYDDFQLRQTIKSNKVIELGPKTLRKITKANKPTYH